MKLFKIPCADLLSSGTFITYINSFELSLCQIKLKVQSAEVILLSEVGGSHVL